MTHLPSPLYSVSQGGNKAVLRNPSKCGLCILKQFRELSMTWTQSYSELLPPPTPISPDFSYPYPYPRALPFILASPTLGLLPLHNQVHCQVWISFHTPLPPHSQCPVLCPLPRLLLHIWEHVDIFWSCLELQISYVLRTRDNMLESRGCRNASDTSSCRVYSTRSIDIPTKASGPAEMLCFSEQQMTWAR